MRNETWKLMACMAPPNPTCGCLHCFSRHTHSISKVDLLQFNRSWYIKWSREEEKTTELHYFIYSMHIYQTTYLCMDKHGGDTHYILMVWHPPTLVMQTLQRLYILPTHIYMFPDCMTRQIRVRGWHYKTMHAYIASSPEKIANTKTM
jgi:hypothetical protein